MECISTVTPYHSNLTTPLFTAVTIGFNQSEYTFAEGDDEVDIVVRVLEGELGIFYTIALDLVPRTALGEQYYWDECS